MRSVLSLPFLTLLHLDTLSGDLVEPLDPGEVDGTGFSSHHGNAIRSEPSAHCFLVNYALAIVKDLGPPFAG